MGDADAPGSVAVREWHLGPRATAEYEFACRARLLLDGPAGPVLVVADYQALPRHNDVVAPGAVDANDELLDRPDAVHVHVRWHGLVDGRWSYLRDAHESWRPRPASVLESADRFEAACRAHLLGDVARVYERASLPG